MRKTSISLLLILTASFFIPFLPKKAAAATFTATLVRLERQAVSKSTGGLVCTTTPSSDNGVENSVQIIFPSGFSVNSTSSNWTVTTSDLPAGAIPWPGISTASSVNGQTVTFPSSDLSASTQYCFNFSASGTLTTPSSSGSYIGTLRTKASNSSTIDSNNFAIGISSSDSINVTATVPASPTDFQAKLDLIHPPNGEFPQDAELIYRIKYGSYLTYPTNITLEADWSLGTISGNSIPTVDILKYLSGTATLGTNNTPPVIDTVNRKITWTFSSFPGDTSDQIVYFRLSTKNAYQGDKNISFSVNARVLGPGTQTADSTVSSTYLHNSTRFVPSGGGSATTPTALPTQAQLSPQRTAAKDEFSQIEIRSVSNNSAQIFVETNTPTSKKITYGTSFDNLNQSVTLPISLDQLITLPDLKSNTRYYFRITATSQSGTNITSDLYKFDTASAESVAKAVEKSLILSTGDVVLLDPTKQRTGIPNIVIPKDTRFSFKFVIDNYDSVKNVDGVVRNSQVLAASTSQQEASNSLTVTELYPGQYIGSLTTSNIPGVYNLVLKVSEYNGNISEQVVSKLIIVDHFKIVDRSTGSPVEKAKTTFYFYNARSRLYELISSAITPFDNPAFTGPDGYISIVLPEGKYKAEIRAIGYKNKTVEFDIGPDSPKYPVVGIDRAPFSIFSYLEYSFSNAADAINLLSNYITSFKTSGRFLELITSLVIILFIALALFQLSRIYGVPIFLLPFFALYHLVALFHKPAHTHFIQGKVMDIATRVPVENVLLHFSYPNGKVVAHAHTNDNGDFTAGVKNLTDLKITISHRGYETFSQKLTKEELSDKLQFVIGTSEKPSKFGISAIEWYLKSVVNAFFESFLVLTVVVEIIFAQQFGLLKVLPAILISVGNILLWALHARPKKAVKSRA